LTKKRNAGKVKRKEAVRKGRGRTGPATPDKGRQGGRWCRGNAPGPSIDLLLRMRGEREKESILYERLKRPLDKSATKGRADNIDTESIPYYTYARSRVRAPKTIRALEKTDEENLRFTSRNDLYSHLEMEKSW